MRTKFSALLGDLAQLAETPNLKAARVCQHRAIPADEFMQSSGSFDYLNTRPQPKVIGVPKNDLRVEVW